MNLDMIRPGVTLDVSRRVVVGPYGHHYVGSDFDVHSVTIRRANQGGITVTAYDVTKMFRISYYETSGPVRTKGRTLKFRAGHDTLTRGTR